MMTLATLRHWNYIVRDTEWPTVGLRNKNVEFETKWSDVKNTENVIQVSESRLYSKKLYKQLPIKIVDLK